MGEDNTFVHVCFAMAIFIPSFGYMAISIKRFVIQTLILIYLHDKTLFAKVTMGRVDLEKFCNEYVD